MTHTHNGHDYCPCDAELSVHELSDSEELECLQDRGDGSCSGEVEYRYPLSGTGKSFPRCDRHWGARIVEQERINRLYTGDVAPHDFDPAYAGERW